MKRMVIIMMAAAFITGCATTAKIENSWKDPEAEVDISKLNKVLVVALFKNETHRRAAESQLAGMLQNKGVASYTYFTGGLNRENEAVLKQQLKNDGFDGAVVLRAAVDKEVNFVPGSAPAYYGRFWPAFWGYYSQPGYYETSKKFTIETNVYSLTKDKLVWTSLTSSIDPQNAQKMMDAVAKEVYKKMKKEGFIVNN